MLKYLIPASISVVLVFTASPSAKAELILPGRCHMGGGWENKFLGKTLLREGDDGGKLYSVL